MEGDLKVRVDLDERGTVVSATTLARHGVSDAVAKCSVSRTHAAVFDAPSGGTVSFEFTVKFSVLRPDDR